MPRGRRPGSHQQIRCGICRHQERGRIDFLVCSGAGVQPTAKKFEVSYDPCATTSLNTSRRAIAMRSAWVRFSPRSSCAGSWPSLGLAFSKI